MELKDRIEALIKYSGLSPAHFAKHIGAKTSQTMYELLKGGTKSLSASMQTKILAAYPEVNPTWLLTGEGEMLRPQIIQQGDGNNVQQGDGNNQHGDGNTYNSDAAYNTLLKVVEANQATTNKLIETSQRNTDQLITLFRDQQAQTQKQMEQTDKLISLLQALIERQQ